MEIIKLKLFEIIKFETEINGLNNTETGEVIIKGLLYEKIKFTTKYWLCLIGESLISEKKIINSLRERAILQYGTSDGNGNVTVQTIIDEIDENGNIVMVTDDKGVLVPNKVVNPKFIEFQNELNSLYDQEKEIEYEPFNLGDFSEIESEHDYRIIFKLIKN